MIPLPPSINTNTVKVQKTKNIVIWNSHNSSYNNSGTEIIDVTLYNNKVIVWQKKGVAIPWEANADTNVIVNIPSYVRYFNKVKINIVKDRGEKASLAEIQVFDGTNNIAMGGKVNASSYIHDKFPPNRLTDGITSSAQKQTGFWIAGTNKTNWVEVELPMSR